MKSVITVTQHRPDARIKTLAKQSADGTSESTLFEKTTGHFSIEVFW